MTKDKTQLCLFTYLDMSYYHTIVFYELQSQFRGIYTWITVQSLLYIIRNCSFCPRHLVGCETLAFLWSSCCEHHAETILLSAIVLAYDSGRHASNVVQRRFCALLSLRHTATVVATVFLRNGCRLASGILALPRHFDIHCDSWLWFLVISHISRATS